MFIQLVSSGSQFRFQLTDSSHILIPTGFQLNIAFNCLLISIKLKFEFTSILTVSAKLFDQFLVQFGIVLAGLHFAQKLQIRCQFAVATHAADHLNDQAVRVKNSATARLKEFDYIIHFRT